MISRVDARHRASVTVVQLDPAGPPSGPELNIGTTEAIFGPSPGLSIAVTQRSEFASVVENRGGTAEDLIVPKATQSIISMTIGAALKVDHAKGYLAAYVQSRKGDLNKSIVEGQS